MAMFLVINSLFYALAAAKQGFVLPLEPVEGVLYFGRTFIALDSLELSHGWQLDTRDSIYA